MNNNDRYVYSTRVLRAIAKSYLEIYEGLTLSWRTEIYNPWAIAEYKADFDVALSAIGRGEWVGQIMEFKYYRGFSKVQRIVIADILGTEDAELERMRFHNIPRLRGYAYYLMKRTLNGERNGKNNA